MSTYSYPDILIFAAYPWRGERRLEELVDSINRAPEQLALSTPTWRSVGSQRRRATRKPSFQASQDVSRCPAHIASLQAALQSYTFTGFAYFLGRPTVVINGSGTVGDLSAVYGAGG